MFSPRAAVPALACLVTGVTFYLSRGVLDFGLAPDGAVRVALLPPPIVLVGFVVMAGIGLLLLDHLNAPRGTSSGRPPLATLVLPAFGLLVLVLPFLPWLPDRLSFLLLPAGPAAGLIWLLVITQLLWVAWHARLLPRQWLDGWSLTQLTLAIGLLTLLSAGAAALRLTQTTLFPAGDEPHYLVISQSLWRDGDLAIENNHERGDYFEYFGRPLEPHYLVRGVDGEIYSVHPIGISVLLAPVYAAGGYPLVVIVFLLVAALAAALMWRWAALAVGPGPAIFGWAVVATSAPFLLNAFTVYPEIPGGLAAVVALTLAVGTGGGAWRYVAIGVATGVLPWLSTKYAPMSAALVAVAMARILLPEWRLRALTRDAVAQVALVLAPYMALLAAWFTFFYLYWGAPWPQGPYGTMTQTEPANLILGAPGLLFDQEYGLLAYAPAYVLAATGLWQMWRTGGEQARRATEIALVFSALFVTVGAFGLWWGGSAPAGRPIVSGLLLFVLPVATAFRAAGDGTPRRAAQYLLLWIGVGFAVVLTLAQHGLLIANARDGSSRLLEYLAPTWHAWTVAPTFMHVGPGTAYIHAGLWLAVAASAAWTLRRVRATSAGGASLTAMLVLGGAVLIVLLVAPWLPADQIRPASTPQARSHLELLDRFDSDALPVAVVFDPFTTVPTSAIQPLLTLGVTPGLRSDPQPLRVLHNGRFSLPAGDYRVTARWASGTPGGLAGPAALALQVGRVGPPLQTWPVEVTPGGEWNADFSLPADASFVGFRGSAELERAIAAITIAPTRLVDRSQRPRRPEVLSAARYGDVTVLFHDERTYPERGGFWTFGRRISQMTIAAAPDKPVVLRIHSGSHSNHVVLGSPGWQQVLDLEPGVPVDVPLPATSDGVTALTITSTDGFVPAELDPGSTDHRLLGAWVTVASEAAPR